jgi:hypothetical protein
MSYTPFLPTLETGDVIGIGYPSEADCGLNLGASEIDYDGELSLDMIVFCGDPPVSLSFSLILSFWN